MFWIMLTQWLLPTIERWNKDGRTMVSQQKQLADQQKLLTSLEQSVGLDVDAAYRTKIADLQRQEEELQQDIAGLASYFIGSEQMASMLHDVLLRSDKVKLKTLKALPPVPLTFADSNSDDKAVIYQHSTLVVLSGDYFALTNVLHRLDQMPWSVSWQSIDYQVKNYPNAELTLSLLTVSDHESYIKL